MDIVVWLRSLGLDEASGVESEAGIAAAVVNVPVLVTPRLAAATAKATPAAWRCSRRCAKFRLSLPLLATLRRAPPVDHRSSYQLRSLTGASNDSFRAFDARRVNGDSPFVSLDPSADRIPDPPVLHRNTFRARPPCIIPFAFV